MSKKRKRLKRAKYFAQQVLARRRAALSGDEHLALVKKVLQNQFPNLGAANGNA